MERKSLCTPVKNELEISSTRKIQNQLINSPLYMMPNISTPPSRLVKIKNPFEPSLTEKLHTHLMSPSIIYTKAQTSTSNEKFRWNIEDLSLIRPAEIDETSIDQHEQSEDPILESFIQAKIDTFFNLKEIVPSPFNLSVKTQPLVSEKLSDFTSPKQIKNGTTQTMLSLPPILPKELEDMLQPYFINASTEDSERDSGNQNSLYRRLFDIQENSDESTYSSPARSLPSPAVTLLDSKEIKERSDFESHCNLFENECNVSPITLSPIFKRSLKKSKSISSLDLSKHEDENSIYAISSYENIHKNSSFKLEDNYIENVKMECMSPSTPNWDMEYKNMSLTALSNKDSSTDEMDVSNSNTPRSKIFSSQRKKLSESFISDNEEEDCEQKENQVTFLDGIEDKAMSSRFFMHYDSTDGGYHTASGNYSEDLISSNSHVFASTPTKMKF